MRNLIHSDSKWARLAGVAIVGVVCAALGFGYGYFKGTGTIPLQAGSASVVPTVTDAKVTEAELLEFLKTDKTDGIDYGEGFNCVEYAFVLGLRGRWQGLQPEVVRIDFDGQNYGHLLLAYETSDKGVVFINPEDDSIVKPRIGGQLAGKRITGMYYLRASWIPITEVDEYDAE